MPPAARITDMHTCPMVTVLVPHVGGPIVGPGVPTVLIANLPAAVVGDMATCTGP
ncbi:MAG: PAAR domain-containing protein, partial [Bacteroidota bacterium]